MQYHIQNFSQQEFLVKITMVCMLFCNILSEIQGSTTTPRNDVHHNILCKSTNESDPKKWGDKCQYLCNCKNNTACKRTGICPNGCRPGWKQDTIHNQACVQFLYFSKDISVEEGGKTSKNQNNSNTDLNENGSYVKPALPEVKHLSGRLVKDAISLDNGLNQDSIKLLEESSSKIGRSEVLAHTNVNYVDDQDFSVYSFASSFVCEKRIDSMRISLTHLIDHPLVTSHLYIRIHSPLYKDLGFIKAELRLTGYTKPVVKFAPQLTNTNTTSTIFVKKLRQPVLSNNITVLFELEANEETCQDMYATALVLLYGVPVCPYGLWGTRCENLCRCPCSIPECHAVTGECSLRSHLCPAGRYGRECERTCSESCLDPAYVKRLSDGRNLGEMNNAKNDQKFSKNRPCHAFSGFCQICSEQNQTGPSCNLYRDPAETTRLQATCMNASIGTDDISAARGKGLLWSPSDGNNDSATWRGQIALLVVAICVLLFILGFAIYVTCVRCLARRRLKDYMVRLDRQRMMRTSIKSWSDLREEFRDFRHSTHTVDSERKTTGTSAAMSPSIALGERFSDSSVDPLSDDMDDGAIKKVSFK